VPEIGQALAQNVRRQEIASARARERGESQTAETLERAQERYVPKMQPATIDIDRIAQGPATPTPVVVQDPSPTIELTPSPTESEPTAVPTEAPGSPTPAPSGAAQTSGPTPATATPGGLRGVVGPRDIALGVIEDPTSTPAIARPAIATLPGLAGIPAPEPAPIVLGPPVPPRTGPALPSVRDDDAARSGAATRVTIDPSPPAIAADPRSVPTQRPPNLGNEPARPVEARPTVSRPDDDDNGRGPGIALNPRPALPPTFPSTALGGPPAPGAAASSAQAGPAVADAGSGAAPGLTPVPVRTSGPAAAAAVAAAPASVPASAPASAAFAPPPPATPTPTRTPPPTAVPPTATATAQTGIIHSGGQPSAQSSGQSGNQGTGQSGNAGPGTSGSGGSSPAPPAGPMAPSDGSNGNSISGQASPTPGR
jgi:hypothetical protein